VRCGAKLGTVGRSEFIGGDPQSDYRMPPHLHFELARRAYPMPAEDPARIEPRDWLAAHGVALESSGDAYVTPVPADGTRPAKQQVRAELMTRLVQTQIEVSIIVARLEADGHPGLARGVRQSWEATQAQLLPMLARPSPVDELRDVVRGWLTRVDVAQNATRAAASSATSAAVAAVAAQQHRMWEAGDWLKPNWLGDALAHFALRVGVGIAIVVGLYFLLRPKRRE
jgi:hypothetical protein